MSNCELRLGSDRLGVYSFHKSPMQRCTYAYVHSLVSIDMSLMGANFACDAFAIRPTRAEKQYVANERKTEGANDNSHIMKSRINARTHARSNQEKCLERKAIKTHSSEHRARAHTHTELILPSSVSLGQRTVANENVSFEYRAAIRFWLFLFLVNFQFFYTLARCNHNFFFEFFFHLPVRWMISWRIRSS